MGGGRAQHVHVTGFAEVRQPSQILQLLGRNLQALGFMESCVLQLLDENLQLEEVGFRV